MYLPFVLFVAIALAQQQSMQGKTLEQALKDCKECSSVVSIFTPEALQTLPKDKPFTLLVPNNEAIMQQQSALQMLSEEQKSNLVKNHVLTGTHRELKAGTVPGLLKSHKVTGESGNIQIGDAKVIGRYHQADNGRGFYVIDKVLTPEKSESQSESGSESQGTRSTQFGQQGQQGQQGQGLQGQTGQDIFQLVQSDPQLSQISQLIQRFPALKQVLTGPLTFFIPTNNAITQVQQRFAQIPQDKAVDFVRFHIAYGIVPQLVDNMRLATLLPKGDLFIKKVGDKFTVNNANVIGQYHQGINGQGFYVIDRVLFPEDVRGLSGQGEFQGMGQGQRGFQQGQPQVQPMQPVQ